MASVTLNEITKRWGDFTAVDQVSLEVRDQEFMVLLGPSGCGKTTTMRMVAGLEEPSEGEIFIGEKMVNDELPKDRDVAMVFQNYGLYPHMSVYENIRYPLKVRKVDKSLHAEQVRIAAEKVQLGHLLKRRPRELSGGQRQRVALARAIVRTPTVFLMDEPLSNLDAKGVISQLDTPERIYNDPANLFVAGFIGSPSMNLIPGKMREGSFEHGEFSIKLSRGDHEQCVLGIRPEDMEITRPGDGIFSAKVYSFELTGESTLITVILGDERIIVRGPKDYRVEIDEQIGILLNPENCFLFDSETRQRIRI